MVAQRTFAQTAKSSLASILDLLLKVTYTFPYHERDALTQLSFSWKLLY